MSSHSGHLSLDLTLCVSLSLCLFQFVRIFSSVFYPPILVYVYYSIWLLFVRLVRYILSLSVFPCWTLILVMLSLSGPVRLSRS